MKKVLVVDDDLDILGMVEIVLSMHDFSVKTISRWEEVYHSIEQFVPDLILLDVSLSGADGREICKKIKETEALKHIPVLIFSANANVADYVAECNAEAFVAKPFEIAHLVQTIKDHIKK